MFILDVKTLIYLVGLGVVTFLYAIPFLPKKYLFDQSKNLRTISGIKIYIIAFVWATSTVIIPLINEDIAIDFNVIVTTIQRYLYVLVVMFPFDIRDMRYDSIKLSTIPQRIGVKQTKLIGFILLIFFFLLEFLKDEIDSNRIVVLLIITIITLLFLVFANKNQGKYYSGFWVEGIPILWLILTLLLT